MAGNAALYLTFSDDELFDELIVPYKSNRMLSDLVIKLLTNYYYNPEVRRLISEEEVETSQSMEEKYSGYFRDINAIMAVVSSIHDDAEEHVKNSLESIIQTAEARDFDEDTWGEAIPKVADNIKSIKSKLGDALEPVKENIAVAEQHNVVDEIPKEIVHSEVQGNSDIDTRLNKMESTIQKLMDMMLNSMKTGAVEQSKDLQQNYSQAINIQNTNNDINISQEFEPEDTNGISSATVVMPQNTIHEDNEEVLGQENEEKIKPSQSLSKLVSSMRRTTQ